VLLERSLHPQFVSNTYLVAANPGGDGVLIDAGGPMEPIYQQIEGHAINVTHLLLTHRHHDHVSEAAEVKERYGCEVLAHPLEAAEIGDVVDRTIEPGTVVESGGLTFEALRTPGHTAGMISFRTPDAVFTGDTLFKGSVGGVRAPGAGSTRKAARSAPSGAMRRR
jgi:glyoxylase-like metal-dependent hydrolase (beta-lactamase superfamily II)